MDMTFLSIPFIKNCLYNLSALIEADLPGPPSKGIHCGAGRGLPLFYAGETLTMPAC